MLALILLPAGALIAGLRTLGDLDPPGAYVSVLLALIGLGALLLARGRVS
jgi:hypothetical protein